MGIDRNSPTSGAPGRPDEHSRPFLGGRKRITVLLAPLLVAGIAFAGAAPGAFADESADPGVVEPTSQDTVAPSAEPSEPGEPAEPAEPAPSAEPAAEPEPEPEPEPSEDPGSEGEAGTSSALATPSPTPSPSPTPGRQTLTLTKVVVSGEADPSEWTLEASLDDQTWIAFTQNVPKELDAGVWHLRESGGPAGYALVDLVCDSYTWDQIAMTITLKDGDENTCTFTNRSDRYTDVGIVKTHSEIPSDTVEAGEAFSWFLEVTNLGTTTVADVVVTDQVPAGLTVTGVVVPTGWTDESVGSAISVRIPSIEPGASGVIEVQVTVDELEPADAAFAPPGTAPPAMPPLPGDFVNTACVEAESDENPDNDCSTDTVKIKAIVANVWVSCINDAPFLMYEVRTTSNLDGMPISLLWAPATGTGVVPADVTVADVAPNVVTRLDWPGVAWDANGVSIDWPGWRPLQAGDFGSDGLPLPGSEVYGSSIRDPNEPDEAWRQPTLVTFSVNPTVSYFAVYPPSTPQCAIVPQLAATGADRDDGALMAIAAMLLLGGAILTGWSQRRRA